MPVTTATKNVTLVIIGLFAVALASLGCWTYLSATGHDATLPYTMGVSSLSAGAAILATTRTTPADPAPGEDPPAQI